jgi:integrase
MPVKSAHDIRRTVAYCYIIALDEIRRFLGHKDEKTTWGYIDNQDTEETTKKIIVHALSRRTQMYLKLK